MPGFELHELLKVRVHVWVTGSTLGIFENTCWIFLGYGIPDIYVKGLFVLGKVN